MRRALVWALLLGACGGQGTTPPVPLQAVPAAPTLSDLEHSIRARIGQLDSGLVAVSVIDFATGREMHINGDSVIHAASTMKVPVMLALFREAERGRIALDSGIVVRNTFRSIADTSHYSLNVADDSEAELYGMVGQRVPARELARRMIVRSSNLATNILIDVLTADRVRTETAEAGGTGMTVRRGVEDGLAYRLGMNNTTTSFGLAKVLAAIGRCSINTRASCNEMVDILSAQEFNEMIPAGLPAGTRVAHKTGWIPGIQHDGAIVYPPGRPAYVVVVLTKGIIDTVVAERTGADISRLVWNALTDPRYGAPAFALGPNAQALSDLHARYRVNDLTTRVFKPDALWSAIGAPREEIGKSGQGRPIYLVSYGTGATKVLLWSQMHGDESTATLALADLISYMRSADDARTRLWRDKLNILMVPMLNPDGADVYARHNAFGIDINRDARKLVTPEARALKAMRDKYQPRFGFNLHDQNAKTRVGDTDNVAAIALLAPAPDASGRARDSWTDAKKLAAVIRTAIEPFVPGHIAKYDDTFNARAFGDLMQQWGTSTVLIESGGWRDDPEKQYLRRVNFVALVGALDAIASGSYAKASVVAYESLEMNGSAANDLLIRGGTIVVPGLAPYQADITIDANPGGGRIVEIGDLAEAKGRDTLDASGLFIHPVDMLRVMNEGRPPRLTPGVPPYFVVTQGADATSEPIYAIQAGRVTKLSSSDVRPNGPADSVVGCYAVTEGPISGLNHALDARVPNKLRLMWRYGLTGMQKGRLIVLPWGDASAGRYRSMTWQQLPSDSIGITITTGFAGVHARLAKTGADLQGVGTLFTDEGAAGRPVPSMPLTLKRVLCP